MEVFFNFVDKINKPIFILYDKNFIHINKYLLSSLGFTVQNRPGSLSQIIESKWKNRLMALKPEEETEIPLIKNGGKIQNYRVRMHQLEIEKSEYLCFILNVKEAVDQILDITDRIFSKIPFPAFTFYSDDKDFRTNQTFRETDFIDINTLAELQDIFNIDEIPDFSDSDFYSFKSKDKSMELFLFKPLPGLSYNYFAGMILQSDFNAKGIDINFVKNTISQSIQKLIQVQKTYGKQSNITHSIWEGLHSEITNLNQVKRHLEFESVKLYPAYNDSVYLNEVIINELEILKSNSFFNEGIILTTKFKEDLKPLNQKYVPFSEYISLFVDQVVKYACQYENNELILETLEEDKQEIFKIYLKTSKKNQSNNFPDFEDIFQFEKQFAVCGATFESNKDSKGNLQVSIGFDC